MEFQTTEAGSAFWQELISSSKFPAQCNLSVHCQDELKELMRQIDILIKEKRTAWEKCLIVTKSQLEKSRNEIDSCKAVLERKNEEVESYRKRAKALEAENRESVAMYETKIGRADEQLQLLQRNYEKLQKKLKRQAALTKERNAAQNKEQYESMTKEKERLATELARVNQESEKHRKKLAESVSSLAQADARISSLETRLVTKDEEIKSLKEHTRRSEVVEQIKEANKKLRLNVDELLAEKIQLERRLTEAKAEEGKRSAEIKTLETRLASLAETNKTLEGDVFESRAKLSDKGKREIITRMERGDGDCADRGSLSLGAEKVPSVENDPEEQFLSSPLSAREKRLLDAQLSALRLENKLLKQAEDDEERTNRLRRKTNDRRRSVEEKMRGLEDELRRTKEELMISEEQREKMAETLRRLTAEKLRIESDKGATEVTTKKTLEDELSRVRRENRLMAEYIRDFEATISSQVAEEKKTVSESEKTFQAALPKGHKTSTPERCWEISTEPLRVAPPPVLRTSLEQRDIQTDRLEAKTAMLAEAAEMVPPEVSKEKSRILSNSDEILVSLDERLNLHVEELKAAAKATIDKYSGTTFS